MKKILTSLFIVGLGLLWSGFAAAQDDWPKLITASDGTVIKVYQPEPENFSGNVLKFRAAISVLESGHSEPYFGTFWSTSKVQTDRDNRQLGIESVQVTELKIPSETDPSRIDYFRTTLESQIPTVMSQLALDEVTSTLEQNQQEAKLSSNISTKPPKVIFTTQPSILVFIDGTPKLQHNNDWNLDVVINSPFTIIKNNDGQFYLFGGHHWYQAPAATGPYAYTAQVPENLVNIQTSLTTNASNNNQGGNGNTDDMISNIMVSTTPAELIQSKGEPNFSPIEGTGLLYVKNSDNDIFMDLNSQKYFVLISGRWYRSKALGSNQWDFIPADQLPADFAKIPEGSPKDNVLSSVAGTDAAREAVMDAQIPQTAKVDRRSATTTVTYNGDPQFEPINGTKLWYAVNTSSTVLRYKGMFYAVDNGIWYVSDDPNGPWTAATERPDDVDLIPPSYPVYNTKYVYIYDVSPDYIYMGYTPGYLNSYIYGPTIVYGTGYYYNPWYGAYYYPRPWSWGFNIGYNPWYGWSFGFGYSLGWFNIGWGYSWGYWHGGWWGPPIYHPAYCGWGWGYHPYGGYYGHNVVINNNYIRVNNTNNIYRNRSGIATRDNFARANYANPRSTQYGRPQTTTSNQGFPRNNSGSMANSRPTGYGNGNSTYRGNTQPSFNNRPSVYSDRQGNVFQRNDQGWQQRSNRSWAPVNQQRADVIQNLNRQQMMRERGQMRTQNFESARSTFGNARPSFSSPSSRPSSGGGAPRSSGGGGGRPSRR